MNEEPKHKPLIQWEFDHYSSEHWKEIKAGNVDKTKSWIEYSSEWEDDPNDYGPKISVFLDQQKSLDIDTYRDQWGTYITFSIDGKGFTVAQEDQTKSFIDSLIAGLTKLKEITDFQTKPPIITEFPNSQTSDQL